jgi:hypothetical protein
LLDNLINHKPKPFIDRRRHPWLRRFYKLLMLGLIDLSFDTLVRRILQLEIMAFAGIILISWVNEIYDLPHMLYGAAPSSINYHESAIETAWALLVLVFVLAITKSLLKQIRHLEGFLPVCSFCKSIRVDSDWVPIERFMQEHADVKMTHSLCPICAKKFYGYDEAEEAAEEAAGGET